MENEGRSCDEEDGSFWITRKEADHVTISDSIDPDTEAYELQLKLVHGHAQNALLDASDLREAGFEVVPVRGLPSVLWKMDGGQHDGALFTTEAALRLAPPETIPDPRDG